MSFGNEVATQGPGSGYGGGHSSTSGGTTGGGSSSGSNFADSVDTGGVAPGQGKGLGANDGRSGNTGGGNDNDSGSVRGSSRADSRDRTVSAEAESAARGVMGMSMNSVVSGAIAAFGDFASQADTEGGESYGNATYGGDNAMSNISEAAAMTRDQHTSSLEGAGVPGAIQARAKPGLLGRALSIGAGMMNPLAGLAVDTAGRAYSASKEIGGLNDQFGTSLDASYSNSLGKQAVGNIAGMAGGKVGQTAGAGLLSGNPYASAAGSIVGGMVGRDFARDTAMEGMGPGQEGSAPNGSAAPGEGTGSGGGDGYESGQAGRMVASAPTTTTPIGNTRPDFSPTDFRGYASYAASFFS